MSERDWKQTPTLDEFNAMYDEDDNIWWRIACGHHQNLYEAAVERYQTAEAQVQRVRELAGFWEAQVADSPSGASWVYMSAASRLLLDALDGGTVTVNYKKPRISPTLDSDVVSDD